MNLSRDIPGYEGLYAACEDGTILSLKTTTSRRAGPLKPYVNENGYRRVNLFKDGRSRHMYVHRLVALCFLEKKPGQNVVNHIDANPANNRADNLEWCTQRHNIAVSREAGNQAKDKKVKAVHVFSGEVREYKNMREAGKELFGKYWALNYKRKREGSSFFSGVWHFEVGE